MVNLLYRSVTLRAALIVALQTLGAASDSHSGRPSEPQNRGVLSIDASSDHFADIFNRSLLKQRTIRSIRARFTETTVSSLLVKPLVAHGTVTAAYPARVSMIYTDPERKTLTMDGKTLVIAWPDRKEREQIDIADIQKRIDQYFTTASIDQLRSMFEIAVRADPAVPHTDRIDMRPRRKQIRQGLTQLELWIDRDSDLLTRMRLTFPDGDQKTIVLEDITLNVPVSEEMFRGGHERP